MAPHPSTSGPAAGPSSKPPGLETYRSVLPLVDELLSIIDQQSSSPKPPSAAEASEQITAKARELANTLSDMRRATDELPGGDLTKEEIEEITRRLNVEAQARRDILTRFVENEGSQTHHPHAER